MNYLLGRHAFVVRIVFLSTLMSNKFPLALKIPALELSRFEFYLIKWPFFIIFNFDPLSNLSKFKLLLKAFSIISSRGQLKNLKFCSFQALFQPFENYHFIAKISKLADTFSWECISQNEKCNFFWTLSKLMMESSLGS